MRKDHYGGSCGEIYSIYGRSVQEAAVSGDGSNESGALLQGDVPRLIDEWQLAPKLWDAVRFEVDQRDEFGQFILTGSAVPADESQISHTGTGRITSLIMRPMSLFESGESDGSVSLKALFTGEHEINGANDHSISDIAFMICRGG